MKHISWRLVVALVVVVVAVIFILPSIKENFWPYKKMENERGIMNFEKPEIYDIIIDFAEGDRSDYKNIRENRPSIQDAIEALYQFNENAKYENCFPNLNSVTMYTQVDNIELR